jgi:small subunit ribosomal protein S6
MNIECPTETMKELESAFRFNDAVIRNLILIMDEALTEPSFLAKSREERDDRRDRGSRDDMADDDAGAEEAVAE